MPDSLRAQLRFREERHKGNLDEVGLSQKAASFDLPGDNLSREVYGMLGMPLDALDLKALLRRIDTAVDLAGPFLLSTPNVNFLVMSRSDEEFRESLLMSDCCPVDGMPLVWMARLLGIPIRERVSGSDIFDALRSREVRSRKLNVFLFGGAEGVADTVSQTLNHEAGGMACVGGLNPGFGSVSDMSTEAIFGTINASRADLLAVFLSAKKAQDWLLRNHERLQIPVRAQFGATINLQAGSVKRAPPLFRRLGLEWLWRIKEEPYLWRRYWDDGGRLITLFVTAVIPLSINHLCRRLLVSPKQDQLSVDLSEGPEMICVNLAGAATSQHVDVAIPCFRQALDANKDVLVDVTDAHFIDPRFFGLFLMARKQLVSHGRCLGFRGLTPKTTKMFRLNGFEFLLSSTRGSLSTAARPAKKTQ